MDGAILQENGYLMSMLTQHYYGGDIMRVTVHEQIDSLLSKEKLRHISTDVTRLVKCATAAISLSHE